MAKSRSPRSRAEPGLPVAPVGSASAPAVTVPKPVAPMPVAPKGVARASRPAPKEPSDDRPPLTEEPTGPRPIRTDNACVLVSVMTADGLRQWPGFGDVGHVLADPKAKLWIDLTDPTADQVTRVTQLLGLHPLIVEDILEGNQRAKIEVTDELVHIVMFALSYEQQMIKNEIDFVLGDRFLLTVHTDDWEPRATHHLRDGVGPILKHGPDHLLWALVDALVDSYFPFIDKMGDEVDDIEDQVITKASPEILNRLFDLKRDLLTARRAAAPVREIFNQLTNRDLALIDHEEIVYFRDVYDHLIRLTDELDSYRELVSGTLDVYLSTINNNLSVVMKRLTGVTVILAGIGAIAGIFGMSEAGNAFLGGEAIGFWLVTGFTIVAAVGAAAFLRKIGWI
jgi:magnesium transporter